MGDRQIDCFGHNEPYLVELWAETLVFEVKLVARQLLCLIDSCPRLPGLRAPAPVEHGIRKVRGMADETGEANSKPRRFPPSLYL
ncbi:hypothetical protein D3C76_1226150 [compost metagenome]